MQNILVTGGAGFIGANFIHWLFAQRPDLNIVNLDALTYAGNLANLKGLPGTVKYQFVKGSITDQALVSQLMTEHQIDTVVHFAAESHVDRSIASAFPFMDTNAMGTLSLLEAARQSWLSEVGKAGVRFHHISTDEVYGSLEPEDPAFSENTPYAPNSPYAASKAASDHLVRAYSHTYGLPVTISNCSNNYGPYQYPEKLIPLVILNALQEKPLPIYGDGQQVRDWLYVTDHCEAILNILQHGVPGETYNIGGKVQITNLDLVERICGLLDSAKPRKNRQPYTALIQFVKDRPGHDRRYAINTRKIESALGWQPSHSLDQGLHLTVDWMLKNLDWVSEIYKDADYQTWMNKHYGDRI